jgi:type I restriction enzyme R subunit
MSLVAANREMDGLMRDGVPVTYRPEAGPQAGQTVTERCR